MNMEEFMEEFNNHPGFTEQMEQMTNRHTVPYGVNTRRMVLDIKITVEGIISEYLFEPNDERTRRMITAHIDQYMGGLFHRMSIQDYRVVCDNTNNTPESIDEGHLNVDVFIRPLRSTEDIQLNFVTTRQGTSFNEVIQEREEPKKEVKMVIKDHFDEDIFII